MPKVVVPIAKGFEEIEAVSIIDILRRGGIEVLVASLDGNALVMGANGITIQTDMNIASVSADAIDMIALPGGWGGTRALADDANVQSLLQTMHAKGKQIGAICAAPFALNRAGVLPKNYTCYPSVEEEIALEGYQGERFQVVEEGNVMTSRGPGTAICFALAIVRKLQGEATYSKIKVGVLATYCE